MSGPSRSPTAPRRFLLATLGSLGDLHPFLALGRELAGRGHRVTLATHGFYRPRVEREGLGFVALPPELDPGPELDALLAEVIDLKRGSEFVVRRLILPQARAHYAALLAPARAADVLVGHPLAFAVRVLAEQLDRPWASVALQPVLMGSAHDASAYPNAAALTGLLRLSPVLARAFVAAGRAYTRPWMAPVDALRAEAGLPKSPAHPLFDGAFSPHLHLCLFSSTLARPQPDWPKSTLQPGYAFYDRGAGEARLSAETEAFLARHPAPVVFTLGSSAVRTAGGFFRESARAARALGRPALLVADDATRDAGSLAAAVADDGPSRATRDADLLVTGYEPYSLLFPHAAAIVHPGGAGTTAQALRAGRPALVVPFAHDQPDHALRVARARLGRWMPRARYRADRAARTLARILSDEALAARARAAGEEVRSEAGACGAAAALEALACNANPTV